jgi:hypothetical protein
MPDVVGMRLRSIGSEAVRNLSAGVTPWWLVVPLLGALVVVPSALDVIGARQVLDGARRDQLEGVNAVVVSGAVDGARCEAMATSRRYTGSGAIRPAEATHLAIEPGSPVSTFEMTPGAARAVGIADPDRAGVHLSADLGAELGRPGHLVLDGGSEVAVAGTFDVALPVTELRRMVVVVVPAVGTFADCVVNRAVALPGDGTDLARVVATDDLAQLTIAQVDSTRGLPVDADAALRSRAGGRWAGWAVAGGGAATAMASVRLRRREVALLRQLGAGRWDLVAGHGLEASIWGAATLVAGAATVVVLATDAATSAEVRYLQLVGLRDLATGLLAAVASAGAAAALVRPTAVLRYLRDV